MKKQSLVLIAVLTVTFIFSTPIKPLAAPFYEGKIVKLIVASDPGGGYDTWGRLFAKHMPKHIPGNPTIIVQNMPGATSIVAANHLYNIAKPDGLTFAAVHRGLPFAQLFKSKGVKFDLKKFLWIGSPLAESNVLMIRTDLPYKTIEDLQKAKTPVILGSAGPASSQTHFPLLLQAFLGINIKMIYYRSSSDIALAIERKEVDGKASTYGSFKAQVQSGLLRPIIRSRVSEPGIENLPVDEELVTDKMGKTLLAMRTGPDVSGRPYIAPPGVPADRIGILRDAFKKTVNDPDFLADTQRLQLEVQYISGERCLEAVTQILEQPEDVVKEFEKYVKF